MFVCLFLFFHFPSFRYPGGRSYGVQIKIVLYAGEALSSHTLREESSYMENAFVYGYPSCLSGNTLGCEIVEDIVGFPLLFGYDGTDSH